MDARAAITVVLTLLLRTATGGEMSPVAEGTSHFVIVEAAAPTAAEAMAVKEIARFLGQSMRAAVRVVKEPDFKGGAPAVFVGQTALAGRSGLDFKKLGPEEWVLRSVGTDLIIAGGRPRGTLYGVYEFLERIVGVRFLDAHTVFVPDRPGWEIPAGLAIQARPAFFRREIFMVTPHHPEHSLFQVRRRLNSLGNAAVEAVGPELGFCVVFGSPFLGEKANRRVSDTSTGKINYHSVSCRAWTFCVRHITLVHTEVLVSGDLP